jgi:hypothetical protein
LSILWKSHQVDCLHLSRVEDLLAIVAVQK